MSFAPTRYDPEQRIVYSEHERSAGWMLESEFIRRAVYKFRRYDQPAWFLWAIDQGLPGLLESEKARELLTLTVTGKVRKRGERPSVNLKSDELKKEILPRVWFHIGAGLPVYHNPDSLAEGVTACDRVAAELGCSAGYAHDVWKKAGGHEPKTGAHKIIAELFKMDGKVSR